MRFPPVVLCALQPISSLAFVPFYSPLLRTTAVSFSRVLPNSTPRYSSSLQAHPSTRTIWSVPRIATASSSAANLDRRKGRLAATSAGMMMQASSGSGEPKKVAALMYTYVDDMLDKRGPFRLGHLDLLKNMSEEGDCLLAGAFVEPCDGGIVLFCSPEKAQEFVDKDPYYMEGLVTSYKIRDYMAVVGTMMK